MTNLLLCGKIYYQHRCSNVSFDRQFMEEKNMKKLLATVLACLMCAYAAVSMTSCSNKPAGNTDGDNQTSGEKILYIGAYEPASGENGAGGKQEVLGMEYANSLVPTVTLGGEEYTIKLVTADNQSSTDKAVSAASELVSKNVSVVLGSYGSGVSIAAADTFAAAKIPAIGCSCTNPAVTLGNDYYYRVCFSSIPSREQLWQTTQRA